MKTKTVIVDLDGLLIDSERITYKIYEDLLQTYGHSFTIEDYGQNYSGKTAVGNMENLVGNFSLPITVEEGLQFTNERESYYFQQGVPLKDGTKELLNHLKENNYKIVLATSSTEKRALDVLKQNDIDSYFDDMAFAYEVQRGKPNPDIFLLAAKKMDADPTECLVLEDSKAGIQAAAAHIPVICIPDLKQPQELYKKMTTSILPSLEDVIEYLKINNK